MRFRLRAKIERGCAAKPFVAADRFGNGFTVRVGAWALMLWWLSDNDYCDQPRAPISSPSSSSSLPLEK